MARILVAGNILIETTVRVSGFPVIYRPTTITPFGISSQLSGLGYNLARALVALGNKVNLVSIIGNDLSAEVIRVVLREDGIDDPYVIGSHRDSPLSVVLFDATGKRHVYSDLKAVPEQTYPSEGFVKAASEAEILVMTNAGYCRDLLPLAMGMDKAIVTHVYDLSSLDDVYYRPFLQAASILFISGENLRDEPSTWAHNLMERYPVEILVIGLGSRGAQLIVRKRKLDIRIPAVEARQVVSTYGAGEAMMAAFVHAFVELGDAEAALRKAMVFASYKIGSASSSDGYLSQQALDELSRQLYEKPRGYDFGDILNDSTYK